MKTILSEEDSILSELFLDIIINETQNLSNGNVAHRAASIKSHAVAIKKIINRSNTKLISKPTL